MTLKSSIHKRAPSTSRKLRRREVELCLEAFGLRRGPHRLPRNPGSFEADQIRRLREALESLGTVFVSFGLYLSTRVDLLSARECRELACLRDRADESPIGAIRNLFKQEFGRLPEEVYLAFEEKPFSSSLLIQQHHAWLSNGQAVTVKLVHPEARESLHYDVELLQLLNRVLVGATWTESKVERAIDDFSATLQQRTDLTAQARAVATLSQDAEVFGILRAPVVHQELSTSRILTVERLSGESLEEVMMHLPGGKQMAIAAEDEERHSLARRLCVAWLRQALLGSVFPVEPAPANITILPHQQIVFNDGAFATLPLEAKANLWDYLIAVVTENPDRACASLLKEMQTEKQQVGEDELRQRFRQIVPFRDGEWTYGDNHIAEHLFLHWKLASDRGYRPRRNLPSFYRGLFTIVNVAYRLAPQVDVMREAFQDVRILAGVEKFREMLSTDQFGDQMDKYAAVSLELPQRLDEALTLMAEGNARLQLNVPKDARNSSAVSIALFLVLASCAVLSHHLAASGVAGTWIYSISVAAFLLLGAMLLRVGNSGR
jgi:ubiquinone biosynthesis protein